MKRFHFQEQSVLVLRRRQRDWAEAELVKVSEQVENARAELRESDRDLATLSNRLDNKTLDSDPLADLTTLSAIGQLHEVRKAYLARLSELRGKQKAASDEFRNANAKVEALETLKAQQLNLHQQAERRKVESEQEFRTLVTWNARRETTEGGIV